MNIARLYALLRRLLSQCRRKRGEVPHYPHAGSFGFYAEDSAGNPIHFVGRKPRASSGRPYG